MVDAVSLFWSVLQECGISVEIAIIVVVLAVCFFLLAKEYGNSFIKHLLHRRNRISLCGVLLFFCAFATLDYQGLLAQFPSTVQALLTIIYIFYVVAVLLSVKGPVLFSRWYLKKYQSWLKKNQIHEHRDFIEKMPWYFLDASEKIKYQILKGQYLYELGDYRKAYEVLSSIDPDLLYPEEKADITIDLAVILLQLGNFPRAESTAETIKTVDSPAYYFLKSYLLELQGDLEAAWHCAQEGENSIDQRRKDARILASLYTQLGRLSCFRNNITEMFRYYYLALDQAKEYNDVRMLHAAYQNLLYQIQLQHQHENDWESLMQDYTTAVMNSSLKNMVELLNFRVALARQRCDREAEYEEILCGYRSLCSKVDFPERYMIEVSTLKMLNNGRYDANEVLADVELHFDSYFTLPLPARFIVLQELTCPVEMSPEQTSLYDCWTPRLVEYAQKQAMDDLDKYERSLPSDCVNERCWVILQRIDFTRRGNMYYDGQQILQWMRELIQIYQNHGQLFKEVEAEVQMLRQFDEMIGLQQLVPDDFTLGRMRDVVKDAYEKTQRLPTMMLGALLVEIAHFGAKLGELSQAQEALNRFRGLKQSPLHFSLELQHKIELLNRYFPEQ